MGFIRLIPYALMLNYTPTASSEDGAAPATNLEILGNLRRRYRATVSGAIVNVTLDVGVGNTVSGLATVPGLFLDWANVASIKIQGNSVTTDWTTPPWNQDATLTKERWTGRRKGFWRLSELSAAAFAYRYLNIQIQNQASDDGAAYFLSRAVLGSITEWSTNINVGASRRVELPHRRVPRPDGSVQITKLGEPFLTLQAPRTLYSTAALNEQLDLDVASLDPFVWWDATLGGTESAWLMQQIDPTEFSQGAGVAAHQARITLREVT